MSRTEQIASAAVSSLEGSDDEGDDMLVEHISFADDDDVKMDAVPLEIADIVPRSRATAQSAGIRLVTTARDFNCTPRSRARNG